jgi:hypothetical protein
VITGNRPGSKKIPLPTLGNNRKKEKEKKKKKTVSGSSGNGLIGEEGTLSAVRNGPRT